MGSKNADARWQAKVWKGVHEKRFLAKEASLPPTRVQPQNYLTINEVANIKTRAHCGNCHAEDDLTHHILLGWLLCGKCRKLYVQALRELTPEGQIARRYRPTGGYMKEETDEQ